MYEDGKNYFCTHWYWDDAENEYELCGKWKFEKNYPDMPDYWHLQELEVETYNGKLQDPFSLDVTVTSHCYETIKAEGPSFL